MSDPLYRRVIVKLSGEALTGAKGFGIDQATVEQIAIDLVATATDRGGRHNREGGGASKVD